MRCGACSREVLIIVQRFFDLSVKRCDTYWRVALIWDLVITRGNMVFDRVLNNSAEKLWKALNTSTTNETKWSNTPKQFIACCRRIVWVCLTIWSLFWCAWITKLADLAIFLAVEFDQQISEGKYKYILS